MEAIANTATDSDLVTRQLARLAAHPLFARSARVRRFLEFTVESQLAGRADQLKEYVLGIEVFDRPASYDPRIDPIVRVEARRVRAKLRAFYESDGAQDELIIEYPRGSYVPRLRQRREQVEPEAPALVVQTPGTVSGPVSAREVILELNPSASVRILSGQSRGNAYIRIEARLGGSLYRTMLCTRRGSVWTSSSGSKPEKIAR